MATRTLARLLVKRLIMRLLRILASVVCCPGSVRKLIVWVTEHPISVLDRPYFSRQSRVFYWWAHP